MEEKDLIKFLMTIKTSIEKMSEEIKNLKEILTYRSITEKTLVPILHGFVDGDEANYPKIDCEGCHNKLQAPFYLREPWVETGKGNFCFSCIAFYLDKNDPYDFCLINRNQYNDK